MKLVRVGTQGQMVCIAEDGQYKGEWYRLTPETKAVLDAGTVKVGDSVVIKFSKKNNTNMLEYLALATVGATASQPGTPAPAKPAWTPKPAGTGYSGKSPAEQDTIKRQAIGHMTSRTLIGMQGLITPDNVFEITEKLYAHYQKLVG